MSSSDVSSVTKYFVTANEGFNTTLGSTIAPGATSVGLNSTSGLTNGSVFVGIIEPGVTAQQVFTGTVDVSGSQITNVVWTRGTNVGHAAGVTIVDYSTGTARNMATTGILKQHTQAGLHTGVTTDTLSSTGNISVGGTLGVTGASTFTGAIGGAGYSVATLYNPYKFRVYRSAAQNTSSGSFTKLLVDTKTYDTSTNVDVVTNRRFVAPIAGFYQFNGFCEAVGSASGTTVTSVALYKNGSEYSRGSEFGTTAGSSSNGGSVSDIIQLSANDYVELFVFCNATTAISVGSNTAYFSGFLVSAT